VFFIGLARKTANRQRGAILLRASASQSRRKCIKFPLHDDHITDKLCSSHPMFNTWMKPELILDRGSIINYWGSDLPIHFTLDMQNYEVYITHFTIRHAHNQAYGFIQNFGLAGSKDGDTWVQLFSQESSPFEKPHDWATLTVPEGQDFYRYFRLTQRTSYKDSPNFTGGPFMFISGFELYGTMRYFN
jgi:hypothetical protein